MATRPRASREQILKEHARELANGRVPVPTLRAVTAYADFVRFGHLPYAGGSFDQPARLLEEMRIVDSEYQRVIEQKQNREQRRAKTKGRRG